MGLQVEEGGGGVGSLEILSVSKRTARCKTSYLPQCCVAISVTNSKLVSLLSYHDLVHLGEYPSLTNRGDLEIMVRVVDLNIREIRGAGES